MQTKRELKAELMNAELRAVTHFRKLQAIERIILEADKNKEMYAETVHKIKRALVSDYQSIN